MSEMFMSAVGALFGGLLAYALLSWVLWDIDMRALAPIVGLSAMAAGLVTRWTLKRRENRRTRGKT